MNSFIDVNCLFYIDTQQSECPWLRSLVTTETPSPAIPPPSGLQTAGVPMEISWRSYQRPWWGGMSRATKHTPTWERAATTPGGGAANKVYPITSSGFLLSVSEVSGR